MSEPVVVVGAGPTGLMLAVELAEAGVGVVVLDRSETPDRVSRSLGFHSRAAELLSERGLLARLGDVHRWSGNHFALLPLRTEGLAGPEPATVVVGQAALETVLADRAAELGIDVRRGHDVTALSDGDAGATVTVATGDCEPYELAACWVVGCDGAQSTVRELAGIGFPGTPAAFRTVVADVAPSPALTEVVEAGVQPGGMLSEVKLAEDRLRVMVTALGEGPPVADAPPVTAEEFHRVVRVVTGGPRDLGEPLWLASLDDSTRLAETYRRGRVFLAGDAAHVFYPMSGQAMDVGLVDAVNLAWKLAAAWNGWAPPGLLDTYHDERHPAGHEVCMNTRAQMALLVPPDRAAPLRELFARLVALSEVNRTLLEMITGVGTRYDLLGPDRQAPAGTEDVIGRRIPLPPGRRPGRGVAVDRTGRWTALLAGWADRVDVLPPHEYVDAVAPGTAVLVARPDGHVIWADPDGVDGTGLETSLRAWLGEAQATSGSCSSSTRIA